MFKQPHPLNKDFKLIVAGGRDFTDWKKMEEEILKLCEHVGALAVCNVSIVSGMARGADILAVDFAKRYNVVLHEYPANWDKYGKGAGFKRNEQMAFFSDGLLAFWDGESRGTKHMIETMEKADKPVWIVRY